jgi:ankyrin repeat protein
MIRAVLALVCFLCLPLAAPAEDKPAYPSIDYDTAARHEVKPHHRTVSVEGVGQGFNQLHLTLVVSLSGQVIKADATGDKNTLPHWSQLKSRVLEWKFTPFVVDEKPAAVEVEEYLDLVPPEKLPKTHVAPPQLLPGSSIAIKLRRSGCYGSCPSYNVTITPKGIVFEGGGFVVASGQHTASVDPEAVRELARQFLEADFYSMSSQYAAGVTDMPGYLLSIDIDGHMKQIHDYVGRWVGMPAVIEDLEDAVDELAQTKRWIVGGDGLVEALQAEHYNFKTYEAQTILKEAATRGETTTARDLLEAGVPLKPIPAPKPKEPYMVPSFEHVGWLNAAARHPDTLQVFIDAEASKNDQADKDKALAAAAGEGSLEAVRTLIAYGANPNADLSRLTITEDLGIGMSMQGKGAGSILIKAAGSGNPEVIREILQCHPDIDARDGTGKTALFAAGDYRDKDKDGARVECIRLLVQAGASVNARDSDGNTPLHETFLTDVEEELLKLGANVNARNNAGETPIFTTVDDEAIPLFVKYGADLTLRNNAGETVLEATVKNKGPQRVEVLRKAIAAQQAPHRNQ